jgi:hypothetical protein
MKMINALVAMTALSAGVAMAAGHSKTPNCTLKTGKTVHMKSDTACKGKGGTWKEETAAAAPAEAAPAAAPAEAAPAAAPAAEGAAHK